MTRRPILVLVCTCLGGLALPGMGWAAGGGGSLPAGGTSPGGGSSGGSSLEPRGGSLAAPANQSVTSTRNGITITTSQTGFLARQLVFSGTVGRAHAGQVVDIERSGHETNWAWTQTVQATVQSDGSFSAVWHANHIGRFAIRAVLASSPSGSAADAAWPTVTVIVYRPSTATLYGPGFYGHRTACGQILRRSTIGVANRTLPCGTKVAVYYKGQMMVVPVIDRGPYAHGADWDLTMATGRILGADSTVRIGAVSLPPR